MKKIIAISLALHILIFNIGLAVNTHFCGGQAVETTISIGLHDLDCGMMDLAQMDESISTIEDQVIPIPCCDNRHQVMQLDDNVNIQSPTADLNPIFIIALVQYLVEGLSCNSKAETSFITYSSPPLDQDIQILFQSFLI